MNYSSPPPSQKQSADSVDDALATPFIQGGLSAKLLILTIFFVLLAEILIYIPSISNYRLTQLQDHLSAARTAALVLDAAPEGLVPRALELQILQQVGARAIILKRGNARRLLAFSDMPPTVSATFDLRDASRIKSVFDAFATLFGTGPQIIGLIGDAPREGEFVEIVMSDEELRASMWRFSLNILLLSLVISIFTAALVYLSLLALFVKPMREISAKIMAFREAPEEPGAIMAPSDRQDEIGLAERELRRMQRQIQTVLVQKTHLAALGLAVSKISHDLRNILASAQLFSDRLSSVSEPTVQRLMPRVIGSINRAIALCQSTLAYGRAAEPAPNPRHVRFKMLIDDVGAALGLGEGYPAWINEVDDNATVFSDPEQLYRAFLNLGRNAVEALRAQPPRNGGAIRIAMRASETSVIISMADNGPGIPAKVREKLFQPFAASGNKGSGLGLAIVAELIRGHGGTITLQPSPVGTLFEIELPVQTTGRA